MNTKEEKKRKREEFEELPDAELSTQLECSLRENLKYLEYTKTKNIGSSQEEKHEYALLLKHSKGLNNLFSNKFPSYLESVLPLEVLWQILYFLPLAEFVKLRQINKSFSKIIQENTYHQKNLLANYRIFVPTTLNYDKFFALFHGSKSKLGTPILQFNHYRQTNNALAIQGLKSSRKIILKHLYDEFIPYTTTSLPLIYPVIKDHQSVLDAIYALLKKCFKTRVYRIKLKSSQFYWAIYCNQNLEEIKSKYTIKNANSGGKNTTHPVIVASILNRLDVIDFYRQQNQFTMPLVDTVFKNAIYNYHADIINYFLDKYSFTASLLPENINLLEYFLERADVFLLEKLINQLVNHQLFNKQFVDNSLVILCKKNKLVLLGKSLLAKAHTYNISLSMIQINYAFQHVLPSYCSLQELALFFNQIKEFSRYFMPNEFELNELNLRTLIQSVYFVKFLVNTTLVSYENLIKLLIYHHLFDSSFIEYALIIAIELAPSQNSLKLNFLIQQLEKQKIAFDVMKILNQLTFKQVSLLLF